MPHHLVIEAGRTERQYWRDLWRYRELFYFLALRDFLVRYKQTSVGILWSLIRPVLTMLVLLVVVQLGKLSTGGTPGPLFIFAAMLPWQFFSTALSESGNSLVNNSNLVSKIYFPRLVVPVSSTIVCFADFLISTVFMAVLMAVYRFVPPIQVLWLPFFLVAVFAASLGVGLWLSALMVKYRDFRFIVPFIVQFGLYASPVVLMTDRVPLVWHGLPLRLIYSLNPAVGLIDGFRWSLLGGQNLIFGPGMAVSLGMVVLLLWSGLWYFRRAERSFADVI